MAKEADGLDKLKKALKPDVTMDDVRRIVRDNGTQLLRNMQEKLDSDKGDQTAAIKSSSLTVKDDGLTAEVDSTTEYVEYGTRFVEAKSLMRSAFEEQKVKFKNDIKRLVR